MEGCIVKHIIWGQGRILSKNEKYIKVLFDDPDIGERTFVYPGAFSKYITYEDEKCQAEVEEELKRLRREDAAQAAALERERAAAAAAAAGHEHEKSLLIKKKKAMAYSRKRAEKLRVKTVREDDKPQPEDKTANEGADE